MIVSILYIVLFWIRCKHAVDLKHDDDSCIVLSSSSSLSKIRRRNDKNQNNFHRLHASINGDQQPSGSIPPQFTTALAIVPGVDDWDRLQRARHYARDPTFHEWPPAVRLFHPFSPSDDAAFDVAQVVEDLEIEPFEVTFDTWVIIPHVEILHSDWQNQKSTPDMIYGSETATEKASREADEEIKGLIDFEENKASRKAVKNKKDFQAPTPVYNKNKKSVRDVRDDQRKQLDDEFGGPCILCLEPDEESKQKLMELREALKDGLNHDGYSSPSSLYSPHYVKDIDMGYRPLIPISKFDSFQRAMDIARRIKGLWGDPLTFDVKELHIVSCVPDDCTTATQESTISSPETRNRPREAQLEWKNEAWGLNAKIMLLGEEIEQDEKANQEMLQKIMDDGEPGGLDLSYDYTVLEDEEESTADIMKWLDEDDDFDEGTQLIIGRTHFFTGDQRAYKGMPATSAVDAKDRALGDAGNVSGFARRRGSTNRLETQWNEGEFGRREKDFMPWGMRERVAREKFTSLPDVPDDSDVEDLWSNS